MLDGFLACGPSTAANLLVLGICEEEIGLTRAVHAFFLRLVRVDDPSRCTCLGYVYLPGLQACPNHVGTFNHPEDDHVFFLRDSEMYCLAGCIPDLGHDGLCSGSQRRAVVDLSGYDNTTGGELPAGWSLADRVDPLRFMEGCQGALHGAFVDLE